MRMGMICIWMMEDMPSVRDILIWDLFLSCGGYFEDHTNVCVVLYNCSKVLWLVGRRA